MLTYWRRLGISEETISRLLDGLDARTMPVVEARFATYLSRCAPSALNRYS